MNFEPAAREGAPLLTEANKRIFHARMYSEWTGFPDGRVSESVSQNRRSECPHFPVDVLSGDYVPELRLGMGCTFRLRALAESATRNLLLKWDALSQQALKRNCVPFRRQIPGHTSEYKEGHLMWPSTYICSADAPMTSRAPTTGRLSGRRHIRFPARTVLRKTEATLSGLLCVRNSR